MKSLINGLLKYLINGLGEGLMIFGLIGMVVAITTIPDISWWLDTIIGVTFFSLFMVGLNLTIEDVIDRRIKELKDELLEQRN